MVAPTILLDISRTIARARLPAATGVDRVERAYIRWALQREALFLGRIGRRHYVVPSQPVRQLLAWLDGESAELPPAPDWRRFLRPRRDPRLLRAQAHIRHSAVASAAVSGIADALAPLMPQGGAYLNVGHSNLSASVMRGVTQAGLARMVLIHDVIPLDHPLFARPGMSARFRTMLSVTTQAEALLVNSRATAERLRAHLQRVPPVWVAPLGIDTAAAPPAVLDPAPAQFLCIGTIEPRKNHALLLDLWEAMHRSRPVSAIPRLTLVGRRGWRNEAVFKRLERSPVMGSSVIEAGAVPDAALAGMLSQATAVLFPSLAEGYGLPLAESLAAGTPVIAADLPALREVGGSVPEYVPSQAPDAWQAMIDQYSAYPSPVRAAQCRRMAAWQPPLWDTHFQTVENALETILVQSRRDR